MSRGEAAVGELGELVISVGTEDTSEEESRASPANDSPASCPELSKTFSRDSPAAKLL